MKLFDSELKVMEVLGARGERRGGIRKSLRKKCIEKGAVERGDPGFFCIPLVSRDEVARSETEQLIDKMFGGSSELFFSSFLKNQGISEEDAARLAKMIRDSD